MKKTWDEKYETWAIRTERSIYCADTHDAYGAGRRHQKEANLEKTAKLRALLKEALNSCSVLLVKANRLEAENRKFKNAYNALVQSSGKSIQKIWDLKHETMILRRKLAKKWWQFWRK